MFFTVFPKLTLKRNINSCPPKPSMASTEKHLENLENKEKSSHFSPICSLYVDTPPFVVSSVRTKTKLTLENLIFSMFQTKKRPAPRNISSFLFNSATDSSCNNSGEAETKLSDSKIFENIQPKTHSTPTVEENDMSNRVTKSGDASPDANIDHAMANLMDNIYGEVWRSTPGLFKNRPERKRGNKDVDELTSKIGSMNLTNKNGNADLSINRNVLNDSVILLNDSSDGLKEFDKKNDSFKEDVSENVRNVKSHVLKEHNLDDYHLNEKNTLNFENEPIPSSFYDDVPLKPSKLDFSDVPKKNKENTKIPTKRKESKKKGTSEKKPSEEKPTKKSHSATEDIKLYSFMASLGGECN